jgi:hypothetical protein
MRKRATNKKKEKKAALTPACFYDQMGISASQTWVKWLAVQPIHIPSQDFIEQK